MALTEYYPLHKIGTYELIAVPFSFETNEVGTVKLATLPYRAKIVSAKTVMQKAAGATDTGTVVLKKGNTTLATVTVGISAAIGEEDAASTVADHYFETSDQISITTAKTTAGGKGILFLTLEVLPTHLS